MARTPKKPPRSRRRSVVLLLATVAAAAGILLAIDRLGSEALQWLSPRERYRIAFADIHCAAPPGLDRSAFLAEVRYQSGFPDSFNSLAGSDRRQLARAFAAHPWVESVEAVTVAPGNAVTVALRFRVPILAVRVKDGTRLVDAHGVLLPESAPTPAGVIELRSTVPAPTAPPGTIWADETVKRALELASVYKPRSLEFTATEWRLTETDGKIMNVAR
ncbi:MAG TPA: hypothetical protein VN641_15845 [Urbifossiella sp.]|nr:hypothetical protein [Urbifossiella sp.]